MGATSRRAEAHKILPGGDLMFLLSGMHHQSVYHIPQFIKSLDGVSLTFGAEVVVLHDDLAQSGFVYPHPCGYSVI